MNHEFFEKVKDCKTVEEIKAFAEQSHVALTDEDMAAIAGGDTTFVQGNGIATIDSFHVVHTLDPNLRCPAKECNGFLDPVTRRCCLCRRVFRTNSDKTVQLL